MKCCRSDCQNFYIGVFSKRNSYAKIFTNSNENTPKGGLKLHKLLTVTEVLKMSGVSRYTLYRDSRNGVIEPIYFGRNVRYRAEDAEEYAKKKSESVFVNYYKQKKESEVGKDEG